MSMQNLYHFAPEDMVGDVLYPLNELKEIYPEVYEEQKSKYEGREFVTEREIPYLNCLWNDVLHFTAVHPQEIKEGLDSSRDFKAFVIDSHQLEPSNTVIYLYQEKGRELSEDDFKSYDPNEIGQYSDLPEETKEYYQKMQEADRRPLMFVRVPHILYQGSIDTSDLDVIEV